MVDVMKSLTGSKLIYPVWLEPHEGVFCLHIIRSESLISIQSTNQKRTGLFLSQRKTWIIENNKSRIPLWSEEILAEPQEALISSLLYN